MNKWYTEFEKHRIAQKIQAVVCLMMRSLLSSAKIMQMFKTSFQNTFKAFEVGLLWVYYMGNNNSDING